jgi:hypothetical protein
MGRIVKGNREAGPQMWYHRGATQKEHGSHCKGEQGGRAPIVVPHRNRTEGTKVRIVKRNGKEGPEKEHGSHCNENKEAGFQLWCHVGAA